MSERGRTWSEGVCVFIYTLINIAMVEMVSLAGRACSWRMQQMLHSWVPSSPCSCSSADFLLWIQCQPFQEAPVKINKLECNLQPLASCFFFLTIKCKYLNSVSRLCLALMILSGIDYILSRLKKLLLSSLVLLQLFLLSSFAVFTIFS